LAFLGQFQFFLFINNNEISTSFLQIFITMVITLFSFCVLMAGIVMCSPLRGAPQALNAVKIRAVHMEFIFEGNDDVPSQDYLIPLFASNPKLKNPDEDFATRLIPFEASQLDRKSP
jgi:hypothetical protein